MREFFSLLGEALRRAGSPAALRGRLSYAHDRSEDTALEIIELERIPDRNRKSDRKLARKRKLLAYWKARVVTLQGRLRADA